MNARVEVVNVKILQRIVDGFAREEAGPSGRPAVVNGKSDTPGHSLVETARHGLPNRLAAAKRSFVTRRVSFETAAGLSRKLAPRPGDLILATVTEVNQHSRLEQPSGRRAQLYAGDEVIVAYGARYATDQFEAAVPEDLGPCDLVAGGGIAARVVTRHAHTRRATGLAPVGVLVDLQGEALNLRRFALPPIDCRPLARNVVAVVGTSMNAGKTTLAASLIRGLSLSGIRVGACKITGTGSGGDLWSMIDAGAVRALDFTDAGHATTAGLKPADAEAAGSLLVSHLEAGDIDVVVVEIADGLLQQETSALLSRASAFRSRIDSILLAASDSVGAAAGARWLTDCYLPLRAIGGLVSASPLASREAERATGFRVLRSEDFLQGETAARLCLQASRPAADWGASP